MFIEKPLARDLGTAERIASRIGGRVPVAVGYQWRQLSFLPALIDELEPCDPNLIVATWTCPTATASWWGDVDLAGGQIVEQATHVVDLSIVPAGPISTVLSGAGSAARLDNGGTGFHKASVATARFANGAVGSFVAACELAQPHRRSVEVLANGVTVVVTDAAAVVIDARGRRTWDHEGADLYEHEQTGFFGLLAHGRTDLTGRRLRAGPGWSPRGVRDGGIACADRRARSGVSRDVGARARLHRPGLRRASRTWRSRPSAPRAYSSTCSTPGSPRVPS
jgi:predicted dehydrogenase